VITRSMSPAPVTLPLADASRLDAVRERLCHGLRLANTLAELRAYVAEVASDLESVIDADRAPDTERVFGAPWEGDSAPATPRVSKLGEEYGV
jgi:hypothetical protein